MGLARTRTLFVISLSHTYEFFVNSRVTDFNLLIVACLCFSLRARQEPLSSRFLFHDHTRLLGRRGGIDLRGFIEILTSVSLFHPVMISSPTMGIYFSYALLIA